MSGHSAEERYAVTMEARRRRSREEKLAIVAEIGDGSVSAVARRHNIAPSLLFRWRREFGSEVAAGLKPAEASFIRVALPAPVARRRAACDAGPDSGGGGIEIVLAGGRRVIVGRNVDAAALRQVIAILEGR